MFVWFYFFTSPLIHDEFHISLLSWYHYVIMIYSMNLLQSPDVFQVMLTSSLIEGKPTYLLMWAVFGWHAGHGHSHGGHGHSHSSEMKKLNSCGLNGGLNGVNGELPNREPGTKHEHERDHDTTDDEDEVHPHIEPKLCKLYKMIKIESYSYSNIHEGSHVCTLFLAIL